MSRGTAPRCGWRGTGRSRPCTPPLWARWVSLQPDLSDRWAPPSTHHDTRAAAPFCWVLQPEGLRGLGHGVFRVAAIERKAVGGGDSPGNWGVCRCAGRATSAGAAGAAQRAVGAAV